MSKYLITGVAGFVGRYYLEHLASVEPDCSVLGVDLHFSIDWTTPPGLDVRCIELNILDFEKLYRLIDDFHPTYILHLASHSSVAYSWQHPAESFLNNTNISLNVIEAVRRSGIRCRVLTIGSSEEYGNVNEESIPLTEKQAIDPSSPYAAARAAQETLCKVYVHGFGMDIVMTRSFNHTGPRQSAKFVIPSFVRQIVLGKRKNLDTVALQTGNIDVIRDFSDVRDVVHAYHSLFHEGKTGEVYNVCSGNSRSLRSIIEQIGDLAGVKVATETIPGLMRPYDNPMIVGSNGKLREHTGWSPQRSMRQTLLDMIDQSE